MKRICLVRLARTNTFALEIYDLLESRIQLGTLDGNQINPETVWEMVDDAGFVFFDEYSTPTLSQIKVTMHENIMRRVRLTIARLVFGYDYDDSQIEISSILAPDWHDFRPLLMEGNSSTALMGVKIGNEGAYYPSVESLLFDLSFYLETEKGGW